MTDIIHASDLTEREKRLLFWASFLSLAAAGASLKPVATVWQEIQASEAAAARLAEALREPAEPGLLRDQ